MKSLGRREFLKLATTAAGGGLLAACSPQVIERTVEVEVPVEVPVKETVETIIRETVEVRQTVEVEVPGETPAPRETVVIRNITRGTSPKTIPYFEMFAGWFMDLYPWIEVEFLFVPSNEQTLKIKTGEAAGDPPEVVMPYGGPAHLFREPDYSSWLSLEPFIEADGIDMDDYSDKPLLIGRNPFTQEIEGMPSQLFCGYYVYNKELFAKAGLPEPTHDWEAENWTPAELLDVAKQLTLDGTGRNAYDASFNPDDIVQYGYFDHRALQKYGVYGFIFGGMPIEADPCDPREVKVQINEDHYVEGTQWWQDLVYKHHVTPEPVMAQEWTEQLPSLFHAGQLAINLVQTWEWELYEDLDAFEWDVCATVSMPEGTVPTSSACSSGPYAPNRHHVRLAIDNGYITQQSKFHDESWLYIKFLTSEEMAGPYAVDMRNCLPARKSALALYERRMAELWPAGIDVGILGDAMDYQYYMDGWRPTTEWRDVFISYNDKIKANEMTAKEAYDEAAPILQQNWDDFMAQYD